nr:MAG TPA: hypothetical protein [Caudoviricetes sp.]
MVMSRLISGYSLSQYRVGVRTYIGSCSDHYWFTRRPI